MAQARNIRTATENLNNLIRRFLAIVSLLIMALTANAQDTVAPCRPKVGVVLSGGGAKGFAHIGALRVIEEAGIPIDYIAGTSMGSIIGGLYAVGYDPDMMQKLCTEQNWDLIIKDQIPRKFIPLEKRINERHYLLTVPYKNGKLKIKRSMIDGMYVNMLLTRLMMPAYKERDFSKLPVPFLCIATDIISADPIEFRSGSLAQSIRSSMSIPFLFEPVDYDGYLLCDGGLTNNFPVRNVREQGADIIIGVDLEIVKSDPDVLDNSLKVLERLISVVSQDESNKARKECDILIRPDIGKANMMSFNDFSPIIKCGEDGARAKFPELKRLADSLQALGSFEVQRHHTQPVDSVTIANIEIEGIDTYNADLIISDFGKDFPKKMSIDDIETIVVKVYSQGYYSNVWYELIDSQEGNVVRLHCKNKTSLNFSVGMHYDNNYGIGMLLNMNARTKHFTYNVDLNVADNPYFKAGITHRYTRMLSGTAEVMAMNLRTTMYNADGSIQHFLRLQFNALDLYFQIAPSVTQAIKIGFRSNYTLTQDLQYIKKKNALEEELDQHLFNPKAYIHYFFNNEDQTDFPRKGWNINMIAKCIMYDGVFKDEDNKPMFTLQANAIKSFPVGQRHAFRLGAVGAARLGETILRFDDDLFFIGGQSKMYYMDNIMSFTGLPFVSVYTEFAAFAKTAWQWNFYKNFYAIASCDAGYMKNYMPLMEKSVKINALDIDNLSPDDVVMIINFLQDFTESTSTELDTWFTPNNFVMGAGLTLGYKTMFGPVEIELSKSNIIDKWSLFVNVGYWF